MKRIFKRASKLMLIVLAIALLGGLAVSAASDEVRVIYNGSTRQVEFVNALGFKTNKEPDLFQDLKGLMPGDTAATQEITIGAKNLSGDKVRIYLRSEPTDNAKLNADYQTLMANEFGDWVTFKVTDGTQEITDKLESGVLLGTFTSNSEKTIKAELSIALEADNRLADLTAGVDWVFTTEVIPQTKPPKPKPSSDDDMSWLTKDHVNYIIGYEDNTVRPNDPITRAEAATIFYRLLTDEVREYYFSTESIYPDVVKENWFYVAVCTLTEAGIFEGYRDGEFKPEDPITRAELAAVLCRFDQKFRNQEEFEITETFPDIKKHWAQYEIEFAATRSYVLGYLDGNFYPDKDITRAETVVMINRCLQRAVDEEGLSEEYINWPDNVPGAWYYYDIIEAANYHDYGRSKREIEHQTFLYENWKQPYEPIDWAKAEKEWILIYTGVDE